MKQIFHFLASMKLAIYLLAVLAGMYGVAAVYGDADIYSEWLFQLVLVIFWLNLFLCTAMHIPPMFRTIVRRAQDLSLESMSGEALACGEETLYAYLKQKKYRYTISADQTRILAKKAIPALIAPQLLHVGILIVLIGALLTSSGVSGAVICAPGQSVQLPKVVRDAMGGDAENYVITVDGFYTEYDEVGAVENWISEITLTNPQGEQIQGEAKVNYPLKREGISIYQNSYKYQYLIELLGSADAGTYALPDDQSFYLENDVMVRFNEMTEEDVILTIQVGNEEPTHALMQVGKIVEIYPGVTIEYGRKMEYTILEVKYAQGTGVVFFGFFVVVLASFAFLFGRYKELRFYKTENGTWRVQGICRNQELLKEDLQGLYQLAEGK